MDRVPSVPSLSLSARSSQQSNAFANPEGQNGNLDLINLAKEARGAFAIIELWQRQPSFDHERMENIIIGIVKQGRAYSEAIKQSVATAEAGSTFASDAIAFCDRLMRAQGPSAELENALQNMKEIAEKAHQRSKNMNEQFRRIRVELFNIARTIPEHVATVQGERLVSGNVRMPASNLDLSSESDWNGIVAQFQKAYSDLGSLITHVASFVDWWADMNMSLHYIERNLRFITTDGSNPFRTNAVKEHWVAVKQKYATYRNQIHEVEDYYNAVSSKSYAKWVFVGQSEETPVVGNGRAGSRSVISPVPDNPSKCRCIIM